MNRLTEQAANAMAEMDWGKLAIDAGASLMTGLAGLVVGAWKWGRASAKKEQEIRDEFTMKISALREETRQNMAQHTSMIDEKSEHLVGQFKESFDGIRRQIDDHKLATEKNFMRKEDFRDFREEYREDTREIKASIVELAKRL